MGPNKSPKNQWLTGVKNPTYRGYFTPLTTGRGPVLGSANLPQNPGSPKAINSLVSYQKDHYFNGL